MFSVLSVLLFVSYVGAMHNFADTSCGRISRKSKIVGGSDASPGEYPWLVSVTRRGGHFCGGTLLSRTFVLTAGHCMCSGSGLFLTPNQIRITLGQHDLTKETTKSYEMDIRSINLHPEYRCESVRHDIAILEMSRNLEWSENVLPACLPSGIGEAGYDRYENNLAIVAGWGWLNEDRQKATRANILQKAQVNVIETSKCRQWYQSQGKKTKIQDSQICAGYEQGGVDSCWADSGGPLMIGSGSNIVVVGVVSTGIGCARPYLPGLYTRISDYMPWITSVVSGKRF